MAPRSGRRLAGLLLTLAGCGALPPASPGDDVAATVTSVDWALDLPARRATTTVHLVTLDAGCVTLASPPPLAPPRWASGPAPAFQHQPDGGALRVCGAPGGEAQLTVSAALDAPLRPLTDQGFAMRQGAVGRFTSAIAWLEGCGRLAACDPRPGLRTPLAVTVTHAADERVLCPGRRAEDPTTTTCHLDTPAPSYSGFTVVAATGWTPTPLADVDAGQATLLDAPGGAVARTLAPADVEAALAWYTAALGPLPYGRALTVATGPLTWAGFEGPGLILLSEALPSLGLPWPRPALHAFAHELGHQWAGNRTTLSSTDALALKEALAELLAYRFEASLDPALAEATRLAWRRSARFALLYPRPTGPRPFLPLLAAEGVTTGPAVLLQLEPLLGPAALDGAVQDLLATPGAVGWDDLRAALERRAGQSLATYFARWVEGAGEPVWPTLQAQAVERDGGWALEVRQAGDGPPAPLVVELDVTVADGGVVEAEARFALQDPPPAVLVPLPGPPRGWTLDPRQRALWWPPLGPVRREPQPPPGWTL